MARVPGLDVYEGVHDLLSHLHARDQTLEIVTRSPDMVPRAFVERHGWPVDIVVGYHQVRRRKPVREVLLLAMRRAGADPADTFHVGDQPKLRSLNVFDSSRTMVSGSGKDHAETHRST